MCACWLEGILVKIVSSLVDVENFGPADRNFVSFADLEVFTLPVAQMGGHLKQVQLSGRPSA